ncbi:regulatory protein RecX [Anaerococcus sp.]|uniref:regulatory protein RecX n=1 Tax=Anaerococcus TaxID=165779 RepID=UPI0029119337|nr:regulatory protein RecX [Anaerococcus sp.]MDU7411703.1 regulatory protein RecX [Anaerococcus sp.]
MIIEAIDYSDKYNLVILTISGEDFSISYDLYNDLHLNIDDKMDFDTYKKILENDEINRAKNLALRKISYAQKTSFEVKKILKDNDYSANTIEKTIEFLNEYRILNDELYVKSYVADKHNLSRWSKNKIFYSLKSKNINEELINKYLDQISNKEEYENAYYFALKKARNNFSMENKQKVYRYLAGKGFDFDIISIVVGDLFK